MQQAKSVKKINKAVKESVTIEQPKTVTDLSKAIALIQNNCSRTKCKIKDYSPSRASGCKKQVELNGRHKIFSKSSSQLDKIKILHFIEYDEEYKK